MDVQYHTATKKWHVQILADGLQRILTGYGIEEDAAVIADYYALKNYGKLAKLNFPELSYEQLNAKFQEVAHNRLKQCLPLIFSAGFQH